MNHNVPIPAKLKKFDQGIEDVSILLGENGQGKSQMLTNLAEHFFVNDYSVIAIATSIYDKFKPRYNNAHYSLLRARSGRGLAEKTVKNALNRLIDTRVDY